MQVKFFVVYDYGATGREERDHNKTFARDINKGFVAINTPLLGVILLSSY